MTITVVIPTRDRPSQLSEALRSVLGQSHEQTEVVVVDDGSDARHAQAYRDVENWAPARVRFIHLAPVPRGHGASFARNIGAARSTGTYLTFIDDDDVLTDMSYLERAMAAVADGDPVDLHLSDQVAFAGGVRVERKIWIEDLRDRLDDAPAADAVGAHVVTPSMLLACTGFAHLNTTVVSRVLFDAIGGFDEAQRYESDRDFYLRAIDRARVIKYSPFYVARHNVPDPQRGTNISTALPMMDRAAFQLRLLNKAASSARPEVSAYARRHRVYALKRIAESFYFQRDFFGARRHAWAALASRFTLKWLGFCLLATMRSAVAQPEPARVGVQPGPLAAYMVMPVTVPRAPGALS
jgi:glycosyltransferase involved in cell wall biosynthesis